MSGYDFVAIKDTLNIKPSKALSVVIVFWIIATLLEIYSENLIYIPDMMKPILGYGGGIFLIPAAFGIPDWINAWKETQKKEETIRDLSVNSKDFLRTILHNCRRTRQTSQCPAQLTDHCIVFMNNPNEFGTPIIYEITDLYWPLLNEKGMRLLYEGEHKPSKPWEY